MIFYIQLKYKLKIIKGEYMGEWEFLHGLKGQELEDAMSTGATADEWAEIASQENHNKNHDWENLKALRDSGEITKEEFKLRKSLLFSKDIKNIK
jgi:hypothetical protein